ncbi:MAG: heavy-metal-associated domain-containing protein [Bacteroidota bacterium]
MNLIKFTLVCQTILLLIFSSQDGFAQYTSARIGVNGLTCSACTRSVEMSIRKLPFIDNVEMNLENTDGILKFKKGFDVDISKVAQAVVDAGFSVRFLNADYIFPTSNFSDPKYSDNGNMFYFLRKLPVKKENKIRFIGPNYQTKKELAKYRAEFPSLNFNDKKIYYVVIVE